MPTSAYKYIIVQFALYLSESQNRDGHTKDWTAQMIKVQKHGRTL